MGELVERYPGAALFLFALVIRGMFVLWAVETGPSFVLTADSQRYDRLALNLWERQHFRAAPFDPGELDLPAGYEEERLRPGYLSDGGFFDGPDVKRLPLFPAFLGFFYQIFGYKPYLFLFAQAVLGSMTCWLLLGIGLLLDLPLVGRWAGFILAVNPRSVLHTGQIMAEVFFIWLLVVLVLAAVLYMRRPRWREGVFFSLVLAGATMSREMGLYLPLVFLPAAVIPYFLGRGGDRRAHLLQAGAILLVPVICIMGWMGRNHHHYGYYAWTAHNGFSEAWYFAPVVMASVRDVSQHEARLGLLAELIDRYPEYEEDYGALREDPGYYWEFNHRLEMNQRAVPLARRHLLSNPGATALAFGGGAAWSMWSGAGELRGLVVGFEKYAELLFSGLVSKAKMDLYKLDIGSFARSVVSILAAVPATLAIVFTVTWIYLALLYLSAVRGTWRMLRARPAAAFQMLLLILFVCVVTGPSGNNRLFAIAYPWVSFFSAAGIVSLSSVATRRPA